MGLYDTLPHEGESQEFGHPFFNLVVHHEPVKKYGTYVPVSIKLDLEDIKKLQTVSPHYKPIIDFMNSKDLKEHKGFIIDAQEVLYKIVRDHDKQFETIVAPGLYKNMSYMKVICLRT